MTLRFTEPTQAKKGKSDEILEAINNDLPLDQIMKLIPEGFDPSVKSRKYHPLSPLGLAIGLGRLDVVSALIKHPEYAGKSVYGLAEERSSGEKSPIEWALFYGHYDILKLLLLHSKDRKKDFLAMLALVQSSIETSTGETTDESLSEIMKTREEFRIDILEFIQNPKFDAAKLNRYFPIHVGQGKLILKFKAYLKLQKERFPEKYPDSDFNFYMKKIFSEKGFCNGESDLWGYKTLIGQNKAFWADMYAISCWDERTQSLDAGLGEVFEHKLNDILALQSPSKYLASTETTPSKATKTEPTQRTPITQDTLPEVASLVADNPLVYDLVVPLVLSKDELINFVVPHLPENAIIKLSSKNHATACIKKGSQIVMMDPNSRTGEAHPENPREFADNLQSYLRKGEDTDKFDLNIVCYVPRKAKRDKKELDAVKIGILNDIYASRKKAEIEFPVQEFSTSIGISPLQMACFVGDFEAVKWYICKVKEESQSYALKEEFDEESTKSYVEEQMRKYVNHRSKDNSSPLDLAAERGYADTTRLLLEHGASPFSNLIDETIKGSTPSSDSYRNPIVACQKSHNEAFDVIKDYVDKNYSKAEKNKFFQDCLLFLEPESIKRVLHLADLSYTPSELRLHPLTIAMSRKNQKIVKLLLNHGYDINYHQNPEQQGFLEFAIDTKDFSMVRLLLERGIKIKSKTMPKLISFAIKNKDDEMLELILAEKVDSFDLLDVIKYAAIRRNSSLARNCFDVISKNGDLEEMLIDAALKKSNHTLKTLLAFYNEIDLNMPFTDTLEEGDPIPLLWRTDIKENALFLMKKGANPFYKHNGETALDYAIRNKNPELIDAIYDFLDEDPDIYPEHIDEGKAIISHDKIYAILDVLMNHAPKQSSPMLIYNIVSTDENISDTINQAIKSGNTKVLKAILFNCPPECFGIDNRQEENPIFVAIKSENAVALEAILEHIPNKSAAANIDPLLYAKQNNISNKDIISILKTHFKPKSPLQFRSPLKRPSPLSSLPGEGSGSAIKLFNRVKEAMFDGEKITLTQHEEYRLARYVDLLFTQLSQNPITIQGNDTEVLIANIKLACELGIPFQIDPQHIDFLNEVEYNIHLDTLKPVVSPTSSSRFIWSKPTIDVNATTSLRQLDTILKLRERGLRIHTPKIEKSLRLSKSPIAKDFIEKYDDSLKQGKARMQRVK